MKTCSWITVLLISFFFAPSLRAGPGHNHGQEHPTKEGIGTGPITLSDNQRSNLGLTTVEAQVREMGRSVEVPAVLVLPPERREMVTAPFSGRVTDILVKLGQRVEKGEAVLQVAPLQIGSPPQTLRAPMTGQIIRQAAVPGQTFTPETSLAEIGDDRELLAQGFLFQSPILTRIKIGAKAAFLPDLFPNESYAGELQRLDSGHGGEDVSFHVYALIPNANGRLRPNFRGRLAIQTEDPQPLVAVPRRAVLGSLGKLFVFVENEEGHFQRREVVVGIRSGDWVEIVEGLLPGEKVVTVGNYQLQFMTPEGVGESSGADEHGHAH